MPSVKIRMTELVISEMSVNLPDTLEYDSDEYHEVHI